MVERELLSEVHGVLAGEGLSVRAIAARLGLSKSTVSRITPLTDEAFVWMLRWSGPWEYVAARNAAWPDRVDRQVANAPFAVETGADGSCTFRLLPRSKRRDTAGRIVYEDSQAMPEPLSDEEHRRRERGPAAGEDGPTQGLGEGRVRTVMQNVSSVPADYGLAGASRAYVLWAPDARRGREDEFGRDPMLGLIWREPADREWHAMGGDGTGFDPGGPFSTLHEARVALERAIWSRWGAEVSHAETRT